MCNNIKRKKMITDLEIVVDKKVKWTVFQPTLTLQSAPFYLEIDIPNKIHERPNIEEFKETLEVLNRYKESQIALSTINLSPEVLEYIAFLLRENEDGVVDPDKQDIPYLNLLEDQEMAMNFDLQFGEVSYEECTE